MTTTHDSPTAAGSGSSATEAFRASQQHSGARAVDPARVSAVVTALLAGVHEVVREHNVTYPEFQAAKQWLIEVVEGGEWPLFLDVFVEHVVEEVASRAGHRTITTQLYFAGGQWLNSDVAEATKPELILDPVDNGDGTTSVEYDFVLEPA